MIQKADRNQKRKKRHIRVRNKISGTAECPRLNVFRSSKNIYAQLINDEEGSTLTYASTLDSDIKASDISTGTVEAARLVGEMIAKRAVEQGISSVVFDRGGYLYHGRIQALAEGARKGGLQF